MGLFGSREKLKKVKKSKKNTWVHPSEYTINLHSTTRSPSWIKDKYVSDKRALSKLCKLACPSISPVREHLKMIIISASQKCDEISKHADKFYKKAISTSDVKEFFMNIEVVERDLSEIRAIENYIEYGGSMPLQLKRNLIERLQIEIRHLIDRSFDDVVSSDTPDEIARRNLQAFEKYKDKMDEKSIEKLNKKYKNYI